MTQQENSGFDEIHDIDTLQPEEIHEIIHDQDDSYPMNNNSMDEMDDMDESEPLEEEENQVGMDNITTQQEHDTDFNFVDDSIQGFFEHKDSVYAVAIHPLETNIVVTGGGDDSAYLWNKANGEKIKDLHKHEDSVVAVAFSFDGTYLATAGMDGVVYVYKGSTGEPIVALRGPNEIVWIHWHPKGPVLLAGTNDGTMWMWNVPSGQCLQVFSGHSDSVNSGKFTPNGKNIVSASQDGTLLLWDPKSATILTKFTSADSRFHQDAISILDIHHENCLVLTGSQDSSARLLNSTNGKILASFDNHTDSVEAVSFCKSFPLAATGDITGTIHIWDINTFRLCFTLFHKDAITKLQFSDDLPVLISSSADKTIKVWDIRSGEMVREFKGHQDIILDFDEKNGDVVSVSDDMVALVFSINQ